VIERRRTEIQNFLDLLVELGLAVEIQPVTKHTVQGNVMRLTWPSGALPVGSDSPTVDDYKELLTARAYSAMLSDGALLQISLDIRGSELVGHRLALIPPPFDFDDDDLDEFGFVDLVDYYSNDISRLRLRCPIRFDFSPKSATDDHPASHATLLWSHTRIPVVGPLSLGHFVRFIFRNFYPDIGVDHPRLIKWPIQGIRPSSVAREDEVYLFWRRPDRLLRTQPL